MSTNPSRRRHPGLRAKFISTTIVVLLVTMSAAAWFGYSTEEADIVGRIKNESSALGRFVALVSPEAILAKDFVVLNQYMEQISRQPDIVYGLTLSTDGTPLTSYLNRRNEYVAAGLARADGDDIRRIVAEIDAKPGIIPQSFEIRFNGAPLGRVVIGVSTARTHAMLQRAFVRTLALNAAIILFLTVCGYYAFRHMILNPAERLMQAAERVGRGDFDKEVVIRSRDEMGRLGEAFNQMMQHLRTMTGEKDKILADLHDKSRALESQKLALDEHAIVSIADPHGNITYANEKFVKTSGRSLDELIGQNHRIMNSGYHDKAFFENMWRTITRGQVWHGEIRNRKKDGSHYWVETTIVPFLNEAGKPYQYVAVRTDITSIKQSEEILRRSRDELEHLVTERTHELAQTNENLKSEIEERKRVEAKLEQLAITDPLTGILNRRRFTAILDVEMKRAARFRSPLSVVFFDIDHFKQVNDSFGHPVGDRVLIDVAKLVAANIRSYDVFARWGGEEFIILAPNCGVDSAGRLAEKLRGLVENHTFAENHRITCSFGAAELGADDSAETLVGRADYALYQAKKGGRNRVMTAPAASPA